METIHFSDCKDEMISWLNSAVNRLTHADWATGMVDIIVEASDFKDTATDDEKSWYNEFSNASRELHNLYWRILELKERVLAPVSAMKEAS